MANWLFQLLGIEPMVSPDPYQGIKTPIPTRIGRTIQPTPTPTERPKPTSTPVPEVEEMMKGENIRQLVDKILAGFPKEEGYNPVNVAFNESSLDPRKVGPLGERGLYQLYEPTWKSEIQPAFPQYTYNQAFDPDIAIKLARWLFDKYGWGPWVGARSLGL